MRTPALPWLVAATALVLAGLAAAGLGLVVHGAGAIGLGAGARLVAGPLGARRRRGLGSGVGRDRLEARIAELRSPESWLRAAGVSPIEEARRRLRESPDEAAARTTAGAPAAVPAAIAAIERRLADQLGLTIEGHGRRREPIIRSGRGASFARRHGALVEALATTTAAGGDLDPQTGGTSPESPPGLKADTR